jgi:hypothetical protein
MSEATARALHATLTATSFVGEDANVAMALMRVAVALERLADAADRHVGERQVKPLRKAGGAG